MALTLVTLTAAPSTAATTGFRDVTGSYQFYKEISWMSDKGITTGYQDHWFYPERQVSREAFAAFMFRLAGEPSVSLPSKSPFKDVKTTDPFYKAIVWLEDEGITTGWADQTFRPDWSISRSAMAAFLYRYEDRPSYSAPKSSPFKDMTTSSKFYKEVAWLASSGMTTGYSDGTFRPYSGTSRAATSAFLFRGYGSSSYKAPSYVAPAIKMNTSAVMTAVHSQVGYTERAFRVNKYNDWIDGNGAWCGVFVSWAFTNAGYGDFVPKHEYFSDYVKDLKSTGVLDWNVSLSDLHKGDVVLMNWHQGEGTSHTAIVDHVDGNGAWFVEGNTSDGKNYSVRGVFYRWRPLSYVDAVFDPQDYYEATH
jgi:hypothetical protein